MRVQEAFVLIILIFCFIGCDKRKVDTISDPALVPVSRSEQWWIARHNNLINAAENQKIVFIGDSITHFWEENEFPQYDNGREAWETLLQKYDNKISNLGFTGDQTQQVLWRLENGEFPVGINPEYVVLMIGTNNRHSPESIAAGIEKIIKIINTNAPSTQIILLSLLPRGNGNSDEDTRRNNAVNEIIKEYDGALGVRYINIGPYYLNDDGSLKEELFMADKLHLTPAGYDLWKELIIDVIK